MVRRPSCVPDRLANAARSLRFLSTSPGARARCEGGLAAAAAPQRPQSVAQLIVVDPRPRASPDQTATKLLERRCASMTSADHGRPMVRFEPVTSPEPLFPKRQQTSGGGRLVVVSNRVPVPSDSGSPAAGGLAVALNAALQQNGG